MTLPLIYTLNKVDDKTKKYIINTIKNDSKNSIKVEEIIRLVKNNNGLDYAEKKMNSFYQQALNILDELPNNEAKNSLIKLLEYVIKREK
jgi:octaprenyl-diphosphate synthase